LRRLNVLFLAAWYPNPKLPFEGVFVREHAQAVQCYDNVTVLHLAGRNQATRQCWRLETETDRSLNAGIPTYRLLQGSKRLPGLSFLVYLWSVFRAYQHITGSGFLPDVLHAHVYSAGLPAVLLGKLTRTPVVVTEHSSAFPRRLLSGQQARIARFALRRAQVVMPVSRALQQGINAYGVQANFRIVPNAVDLTLFHPPELPVVRDEKALLFVGSLIPVKGLDVLLNALAQLGQMRNDWHMDLVGDGTARKELEQQALRLGLAGRVKFRGAQSKLEVAESMRYADLFVLPSRWENLPSVAIEAIASGLPIVATTAGGIPEVVTPEVGLLVPPEDPARLAEALNQALTTLPLLDRQRIARLAEPYSPSVVGRQIDAIYRDCLHSQFQTLSDVS
jgi:glycosyltransferase involved in cell wall biosynthesis